MTITTTADSKDMDVARTAATFGVDVLPAADFSGRLHSGVCRTARAIPTQERSMITARARTKAACDVVLRVRYLHCNIEHL